MICNRNDCSTRTGPCPLTVVAALLYVAALLAACGPGAAPSAPETAPPAAAESPRRMTADQFVAAVAPSDAVVDVRTPDEFAAGHLEGAMLADVTAGDFERRVAGLERDRTIYVYCRSGNRSERAAGRMRAMGFTRVVNVGGYADLRRAGAPVVE